MNARIDPAVLTDCAIADIALADYGNSNAARFKYVYREGLGLRYGRQMQTIAGVHFEGTLETAYRACLWSRLASRILLPLLKIEEISADRLYEAAHAMAWEDHIAPNGTIAVDAHGVNDSLRNTQFTQQRVKDAIVDAGPWIGSPVAGCISSQFKKIHVPAYDGSPVVVGKSFSLR